MKNFELQISVFLMFLTEDGREKDLVILILFLIPIIVFMLTSDANFIHKNAEDLIQLNGSLV